MLPSRSLSCPRFRCPVGQRHERGCARAGLMRKMPSRALSFPNARRAIDALGDDDEGREIRMFASLSIKLRSHSSLPPSSHPRYSLTGRRRASEGFGDGDRRPSQGRVGCRGRDNDDDDDDDGLGRRGDLPSLCGRSTSCCCCRCCSSAASLPERRARRASGDQEEGQQGVGDGGNNSCCKGLRRRRRRR